MKTLIRKLVETTAPSGFEKPIRDLIQQEIEPYADEVRVDNLGNLVARKGQGGKKIMLAAHMDEIGVMVTHIDENGFVRFTTIGGVYARTVVGGRVRFLNGVSGVIGVERVKDANRLPGFEGMFIDVGVASRDECPLRVGDVGAFERPFLELGRRLVAKSMDDRIAVAVLIEALRRISEESISLPNEVYFVFSTQEEIGTRGAITSAYAINPDLGVAVDVTGTGDTPKGARMEVSLGKGPAIKVRDGGMIADPRVVSWMVQTAENVGLPYQLEVLEGGTTDARSMQIARAGVPAGCLSIPCRYIHTPSEMVDYEDVQQAVQLLVELLRSDAELES
jgi:tetrahedral aminopeptidase